MFLSLLERSGPFLGSFRHWRFLLRHARRRSFRVRRSAEVALRAVQQFINFRLWNLRLAELCDGLHFPGVELAIRPGALLSEDGGKLRRSVGFLVHRVSTLWRQSPAHANFKM